MFDVGNIIISLLLLIVIAAGYLIITNVAYMKSLASWAGFLNTLIEKYTFNTDAIVGVLMLVDPFRAINPDGAVACIDRMIRSMTLGLEDINKKLDPYFLTKIPVTEAKGVEAQMLTFLIESHIRISELVQCWSTRPNDERVILEKTIADLNVLLDRIESFQIAIQDRLVQLKAYEAKSQQRIVKQNGK